MASATHSPPPKPPAKPRRIAAAGGSRFTRTRTRASSAATMTCSLRTACARLSKQGVSKFSRSRSCDSTARNPPRNYELLVRLIGDAGTHLSPTWFMSAATRYRMLVELDRAVVGHVLAKLEAQRTLLARKQLRFSVNLSRPLDRRPGFPGVDRLAHRRRRHSGRMAAVRDHRNRGGSERRADPSA